jgi:hypothetical protein
LLCKKINQYITEINLYIGIVDVEGETFYLTIYLYKTFTCATRVGNVALVLAGGCARHTLIIDTVTRARKEIEVARTLSAAVADSIGSAFRA